MSHYLKSQQQLIDRILPLAAESQSQGKRAGAVGREKSIGSATPRARKRSKR